MSRTPIQVTDTVRDVMMKMCEGNPGAINVLVQLAKRPDGILSMLDLDDMNIRGSQIWVAYKDHCGQDIERLVEELRERSQALVDAVNGMAEACGTTERVVRYDGAPR